MNKKMQQYTQVPVTIYGNLEPYNQVISKARCRIFYKGANRNGTYIYPEFAEKLLSTIAYTPVKGIFDANGDYTDHGVSRAQGRIYGVVPSDYNFQWEKHVDEDGIEREYACVDVFLYTGLYAEAKIIPGKSLSMELYADSIKGDWKIIEGRKFFVYDDASFLGLQALGDGVEPCFEGAAFYTTYNFVNSFIEQLAKAQANYSVDTAQANALADLQGYLKVLSDKMEQQKKLFQKEEGGQNMPSLNFKLSDDAKFNLLWSLLNPNYCEEGNWTIEYSICEVYDDYALVHNYFENSYERVYYNKNDETDSLEIASREECFIVDISKQEKSALEALRSMNGGTFEKADETFSTIPALNEQISEKDTKIEELNTTISTLNTERDEVQAKVATIEQEKANLTAEFTAAKESLEAVTTERDTLATYKKNVEDDAKKAVIASYADTIAADVLNTYSENLDAYSTIEELDMKLTYEVKRAHPEIFSKDSSVRTPKDNSCKGGIQSILDKYENK